MQSVSLPDVVVTVAKTVAVQEGREVPELAVLEDSSDRFFFHQSHHLCHVRIFKRRQKLHVSREVQSVTSRSVRHAPVEYKEQFRIYEAGCRMQRIKQVRDCTVPYRLHNASPKRSNDYGLSVFYRPYLRIRDSLSFA